ncbi:MAG: hypothetical protein IJI05_00120 [Erysipelotrichaceae bacterium]|nr:hypothetical protein [Erysipelotrichaceae bacterium]
MKKSLLKLTAVLTVICIFLPPVHAEEFPDHDTDWQVSFDGGNTINSNYTDQEIADALAGMQPGDSATLKFKVINKHSKSTYWWMENTAVQSLEDSADVARYGGYAYEVLYYPSDGSDPITIYSSKEIGGSADSRGEGLHQATEGMGEENLDENFFFLDEIASGANGELVITVVLDGDSQANSYQLTEAVLRLRFAVEVRDVTPREEHRIVYTGDSSNLQLYVIGAGASGLLVIISAIYLYRTRKGDKVYESR